MRLLLQLLAFWFALIAIIVSYNTQSCFWAELKDKSEQRLLKWDSEKQFRVATSKFYGNYERMQISLILNNVHFIQKI